MTAFRVGDTVTGNVQGLTEGTVYTVAEVVTVHYGFGTFVTYFLHDAAGTEYQVRNGHLVLRAA